MVNYEKLYKFLFNGITAAIEEMDKRNYGLAKEKLLNIQQVAEEIYISTDDFNRLYFTRYMIFYIRAYSKLASGEVNSSSILPCFSNR